MKVVQICPWILKNHSLIISQKNKNEYSLKGSELDLSDLDTIRVVKVKLEGDE